MHLTIIAAKCRVDLVSVGSCWMTGGLVVVREAHWHTGTLVREANQEVAVSGQHSPLEQPFTHILYFDILVPRST